MSKYGKYTGNQIESVLNRLGGDDVIGAILNGTAQVTVEMLSLITQVFSVSVNYDVTQEELISQGSLHWSRNVVHRPKFGRPPQRGIRLVEFFLFNFKERVDGPRGCQLMKTSGYRPINFWELVYMFSRGFRADETKHVVCLGSIAWIDNKKWVSYVEAGSRAEVGSHIPCTAGKLMLREWNDDWGKSHIFPAVREDAS